MLATSRQPLSVNGEWIYRVPSLEYPRSEASLPYSDKNKSATHELIEYDAVRLFIQRAAAQKERFKLTAGQFQAIAEICELLDGIPLAIEMAAARERTLSIEEIRVRLADRFLLLSGGSRTALPRHQTMRALIDWSYDLLNNQEKLLLARLSVFAGGWFLEAAEAVSVEEEEETGRGGEGVTADRPYSISPAHSPHPAPCSSTAHSSSGARNPGRGDNAPSQRPGDVLDLLSALVDKSLVVLEDCSGKSRYSLLQTVRQYARDRLITSGGIESARKRHTDFYLELTDQARLKLDGPDQAKWYRCLEEEHDNLRVALDWSLSTREEGGGKREEWGRGDGETGRRGEVQSVGESEHRIPNTEHVALLLCGALFRFWLVRGHLSEGRLWCARALEKAEAGGGLSERAKVLIGSGLLSDAQGDYASARVYHNESLVIWQEIGDQHGIAASLNNLGMLEAAHRDYDAARDYFHRGLAIYQEIGHRSGAGYALNNLGRVAVGQGDFTLARDWCEQSLTIQREIGHQHGIALALVNLAEIAETLDDSAAARGYCEQSLVIQREIGNRAGAAFALMKLGNVANTQGDYVFAKHYSEESLTIFREIGDLSGIANSLFGVGIAVASEGNPAVARAYIVESFSLFTELGDRVGNAASLELLARMEATENRPQRAGSLLGAAQALRDQIGLPRTPAELAEFDRAAADVRLRLGEDEWDAAWTQGRAMKLDDAIALAIQTPA